MTQIQFLRHFLQALLIATCFTKLQGFTTPQFSSLKINASFKDHQPTLLISSKRSSQLFVKKNDDESRRIIIKSIFLSSFVGMFNNMDKANAVERAVGSAELSCREEGNCLEKGDWDGAVGWNWGGKDRCDAADPKCGPDGVLRDSIPSGSSVPEVNDEDGNTLNLTNYVDIEVAIGKAEKGTLRIGLYGDACPKSVAQMLGFLGDSSTKQSGLVTTSSLVFEEGIGVVSLPVSLSKGGVLNTITPGKSLDFGVPSQGAAYAKFKGLNRPGDNFLSQPRPSGSNVDGISEEKSARKHSCAGLISVPKSGLGYAGNGLETDDEAFASAFQITASSASDMDKQGRKVIGQLCDSSSMDLLARLASLPTKKGLKGIIPGQNSGPPLLKVSVVSVMPEAINDS